MFEKADLKPLCRKLGLREDLALIERAWEAEADGMLGLARVVALDNQALLVEVTSSPALQEVSLRRRELLRRMNRYFSVPFLKEIHVRMAHHG